LARAVGLSRRSLERSFRSITNESILDFRTRERVRYAQDLLCRGVKIEAAARQAGWKSKKDLYRAFRSVLGSLPSVTKKIGDLDPAIGTAKSTVRARHSQYN
jgi:transcriptional regulator GlxA family with amidase domain